jgi:hypothetical protein
MSGHPQKPPQNQSPTRRNPPEAHRFKPGQSGNPSGRPKGIKSVDKELEAALKQMVRVRVGARFVKMTRLEAMTRTLADKAVAGDAKAVRLLIDRLKEVEARAAAEPGVRESFSEKDREVIAAVLVRLGVKG